MDFIIREEDGWMEISDLIEEMLPGQVVDDLWAFMAEERVVEAVSLLEAELGGELERMIGTANVQNIRMVETPGMNIRIWVKH